MERWGSESSDRRRRTEELREESEDRRVESAEVAWWREESWARRSEWRERTSERSWLSRRRMAWWSFSAVEAGEPEERAAEEKEVEEKEGERKAEKTGSEAKESRAEVVVVVEVVEGEVGVVAVAVAEEGFLKVERRWRGDAVEERGDLADDGAAGDAIVVGGVVSLSLWLRRERSWFYLFDEAEATSATLLCFLLLFASPNVPKFCFCLTFCLSFSVARNKKNLTYMCLLYFLENKIYRE